MYFTDIFIKRPVLATVVSLFILLLGFRSISGLPLRQFPKLENTVITVTTTYPGASPELMQGFITTPLQKAIASADGIDYITASSTQSVSTIQVYIKLNYSPNDALTEIMGKVAQAKNDLPRESNEPVITKSTGDTVALMYVGFSSPTMTPEQITDYLTRVVQPNIETVSGISNVQILGGNTFALRIWPDPEKMSALNIVPQDIAAALQSYNYQSAAGSTKGEWVVFNINAKTDLNSPVQFSNMVIKYKDNNYVRLKDIARVELGSVNYDSNVIFNGKTAVFIGIYSTPSANPLTVIEDVRALLPSLERDFPPGLKSDIVYDSTRYIKSSINEVIKTIAEATIIVFAVVFMFLGTWHAVSVPMVTIPLSLIGVCSVMLALNYSINLLTLLAMVLAIGLVVDDAIVVVENVYRHIEEKKTPFQAALLGAKEIAWPVISMTVTLAAVFAPIGFMGGLTGSLFSEFALTLAGAVIISGVIALTLSPMMCSRLLLPHAEESWMAKKIDQIFGRLKNVYTYYLKHVLENRSAIVLLASVVLISCFLMFKSTPKELAPEEDKSILFGQFKAPDYANIDYLTQYKGMFQEIYSSVPAVQDYFLINGTDNVQTGITGAILKPWNDRDLSQKAVQKIVQEKMNKIPGLQIGIFPLPPLPGAGSGFPIEFVINSTMGYPVIYNLMEKLQEVAKASGLFVFMTTDLNFSKPELTLDIDRDKAASLGVTMADIGSALALDLGENYVNRFSMEGRSYEVITQLPRMYRANPSAIGNIYVRTLSGKMIPLSSIASMRIVVQPNALTQFQQLNAATFQAVPMPGITSMEALKFLQKTAEEILPKGVSYAYSGQSRQAMQEGNRMMMTFLFALIVIYLVLAAQFESWRDPLIILLTVPTAICGALIPLNLGAATLNIYTEIGLVTLIGLISKHGILMIEFANKLREEQGLSIHDAISEAAAIRLRPILMTTLAMVTGVIPLVLASGAGAVSRFDIGLVIATGMTIGTCFTLFVLPVIYTYLAHKGEVKA